METATEVHRVCNSEQFAPSKPVIYNANSPQVLVTVLLSGWGVTAFLSGLDVTVLLSGWDVTAFLSGLDVTVLLSGLDVTAFLSGLDVTVL